MVRVQQKQKEFYFGWKFLTSLATVLRLMYPRLDYAVLLSIASIVCAGGYEVVSYNVGKIIGKFYNVLLSKNEVSFWKLFWKATLIYFGQSLVIAGSSYRLNIIRNLTRALHELYYRRSIYYTLNCVDNAGIDNPDQRITQDVERMCSILAKNIFPYILISPGVIGWYTYTTWSIAGGFGVAIIYVYFIISVIANRILVSPLTKWTARVEKREGDFRYKHVTVRNKAEESAFYNAAKFEEFESDLSFKRLFNTQLNASLWKYPAQFLQNFIDYYGAVLSYLIILFPVFIFHSYDHMDGPTLAQQISNNAFYFLYLINSFTRLTDLAIAAGEMAGYTQRINELICYMRQLNKEDSITWSFDAHHGDPNDLLVTRNLSYTSPGETDDLVSDLNLNLKKGQRLLITGTSGVGKSSLLRIIRKLWRPHSGKIVRNFSLAETMFIPQRPYFPPGQLSLRQQVVFPLIDDGEDSSLLDSNKVLKILEALRLRSLISMCGGLKDPANFEWQDMLSPGEQQRLSIARVLFHKPNLVFLDEATSSLSVDAEAAVYQLLNEHGITYVSSGHRPSLRLFHDVELQLTKDHGWKLVNIEVNEKTDEVSPVNFSTVDHF
ncbi:unnamed protein product [Cylicocyclus nassatus]|uniref:Uncharacterized protein n=1 Tax=Cylicocyclus nassatus TaxID=53992 RepID=A0AA36HEB7_CYLNA|nr:unnamed protein product [Cylicocyclus nassatus]